MSFGVLILALGKSVYGELALNCALSIKSSGATVPIYLIAEKSAVANLTAQHFKYFDEIKYVNSSFYEFEGKPSFFRVKTKLHELTPFKKTLYLDADVLIFRNNFVAGIAKRRGFVAQCWNLIDLDTQAAVKGSGYRVGSWMNLQKMRELYNLHGKKFMQINSSFIFFDVEDKKTMRYLCRVKELAHLPHPALRSFRNDIPDEFFYHLASAELEFSQSEIPFVPLWGHMDCGFDGITKVVSEYAGIMLYGVEHPLHVVSIYNSNLELLYDRFKIRDRFYYVPKKHYGIKVM